MSPNPIIVALDVETADEARALVRRLGGRVSFYKVGMELYAAAEDPTVAIDARTLSQHLANFHNVPIEEIRQELVSLEGEQAVRHLFRVAASLDSMVLGEAQILSQGGAFSIRTTTRFKPQSVMRSMTYWELRQAFWIIR